MWQTHSMTFVCFLCSPWGNRKGRNVRGPSPAKGGSWNATRLSTRSPENPVAAGHALRSSHERPELSPLGTNGLPNRQKASKSGAIDLAEGKHAELADSSEEATTAAEHALRSHDPQPEAAALGRVGPPSGSKACMSLEEATTAAGRALRSHAAQPEAPAEGTSGLPNGMMAWNLAATQHAVKGHSLEEAPVAAGYALKCHDAQPEAAAEGTGGLPVGPKASEAISAIAHALRSGHARPGKMALSTSELLNSPKTSKAAASKHLEHVHSPEEAMTSAGHAHNAHPEAVILGTGGLVYGQTARKSPEEAPVAAGHVLRSHDSQSGAAALGTTGLPNGPKADVAPAAEHTEQAWRPEEATIAAEQPLKSCDAQPKVAALGTSGMLNGPKASEAATAATRGEHAHSPEEATTAAGRHALRCHDGQPEPAALGTSRPHNDPKAGKTTTKNAGQSYSPGEAVTEADITLRSHDAQPEAAAVGGSRLQIGPKACESLEEATPVAGHALRSHDRLPGAAAPSTRGLPNTPRSTHAQPEVAAPGKGALPKGHKACEAAVAKHAEQAQRTARPERAQKAPQQRKGTPSLQAGKRACPEPQSAGNALVRATHGHARLLLSSMLRLNFAKGALHQFEASACHQRESRESLEHCRDLCCHDSILS